jgi:hypothetical protein
MDTTDTAVQIADTAARIARARALWTPEYLAALTLREGPGRGSDGDRCAVQEARNGLGYDSSTDEATPCMSTVCRQLTIAVQDARPDWRAEVRYVLPALIGSRVSDDVEERRIYRLIDWIVREMAPCALRVLTRNHALAPHLAARASAYALEAISPIVDEQARMDARKVYLALDIDIDLNLTRVIDLALDRVLDSSIASAISIADRLNLHPSPVTILRELCEMR